jgi:hypothetical protein
MSIIGFEKESREAKDRAALQNALREHAGKRFRAAGLKLLTRGTEHRPHGVPKSIVHRLLVDVPGIEISEDAGGFWYAASASVPATAASSSRQA